MLTLSAGETEKPKWSTKMTRFDCSCGRTGVLKPWAKVASGHTKSCGQCNVLPASYWASTKFGKLQIKSPRDLKPKSSEKVEWLCDCGKETVLPIARVTSGGAKSCGRCNFSSAEEWSSLKFGKLRMDPPVDTHSSSGKKVRWACDCGKFVYCSVIDVARGHSTSCGKCNIEDTDFWSKTKFGRLKMADPLPMHLRSNKKVRWVCSCGGSVDAIVQNVTRGRTTSCGKCKEAVDSWFVENETEIKRLKPPILKESLPLGPLVLLETVGKTSVPVAAVCPSCCNTYFPRWDHIRTGVSLTCGCTTNRVSKSQREIFDFIKQLGLDAELEYKVGNVPYDIFVPSKNLLVEFQGLRWHSMPTSKARDMAKLRNAVSSGFEFMAIYEDEWIQRRSQIENLLRNRLGKSEAVRVRPSKTEIRQVPSSEANEFHEKFHYIGKCRASVSYGVFFQDKLIACCSFGKPTRQSVHDWELIRMTSDPSIQSYGIWTKIMRQFEKEFHPASVVSFSDVRLFSGKTYEKIGFAFDGDVPQNYYWVLNGKRFNKSGLRKNKEERKGTKTEAELRESQGYFKIWDLGKKRWVWRS